MLIHSPSVLVLVRVNSGELAPLFGKLFKAKAVEQTDWKTRHSSCLTTLS